MKRVAILVLSVLLVFSLYWLSTLFAPKNQDTTPKNFVINQGDGINQIGIRLEQNKLIKSRFVFMILAKKMGLESKIQAGLFKLSSSQSPQQILATLSSGGRHDYWLKIIEGQRLSELDQKFPSNLEGYLFPDSYLIPDYYNLGQITDIIKKNFDQKYAQALVGATNTTMSQSQIITLASVLEREARTLNSKRQVAGILLNRLNLGMALQVDASVQYARDSVLPHPDTYWLPVKKSDLSINSLYNTYLHPGLPPGPICNPGYDSIYAALHPIDSDYIYYITGNDNQMHYSKTLAEHNANIAKYLK